MKCHVVRICLDNSSAWAEHMGLTAQQYSNYENGYPLPRDPAIVLATVWIGTASSEMQLRRREGSGPSQ